MMKQTRWFVAVLICASALAIDSPRGTVPKVSADQYPAHTAQDGIAIGATLLNAKQARQLLSARADECCMVVEVALYPVKDGWVEVSVNDFALRVVGQDIAAKPSSPQVVAGKAVPLRQAEPEPKAHNVDIVTTTGIGYESGGIDPVTGQRRPGGVVTSAGVGVGVGGPVEPKPVPTEEDRRTLEQELHEKSLPAGSTDQPVAGYVYFTIARKKNAKYQFEYSLNGNKVVLPL